MRNFAKEKKQGYEETFAIILCSIPFTFFVLCSRSDDLLPVLCSKSEVFCCLFYVLGPMFFCYIFYLLDSRFYVP